MRGGCHRSRAYCDLSQSHDVGNGRHFPLEHGIYDNAPFDPMHKNNNGLYWYSKDIRALTLWQAADRAGLVTASVAWPVTVGAPWIRYNVPEYGLGATDDIKLIEAIATPTGMLVRLEAKLGPYARQGEKQEDGVRTRLAVEILKEFKPDFMTVHFNGLDDRSHEHGPFSVAADATLEGIDTMVADVRAAALANNPATVIVVVSDHGFAPVERAINWRIPFTAQHLIDPRSSSWNVDVWPGDGSAAVMLRDPNDAGLRSRVAAVLTQLARDAPQGSMRIITGPELQRLNGWPNAAFVIDLTPGYVLGDATTGPLVTLKPGGGTHGYLPDHPEMRAAFLYRGAVNSGGTRSRNNRYAANRSDNSADTWGASTRCRGTPTRRHGGAMTECFPIVSPIRFCGRPGRLVLRQTRSLRSPPKRVRRWSRGAVRSKCTGPTSAVLVCLV